VSTTDAFPTDVFAPAASGGRFSAYAVTSRSGPHVTMQAGVVHADRFWTTTSGSSLKARSVLAHGVASAVIDHGVTQTVVAGRTSALRPFRPLDVLADPAAPLRAAGAVVRLGFDQLQQLIGYLEAAGQIPTDWFPHRRVLLVTRLDRSLTLDGLGVVDVEGRWPAGHTQLRPDGAGSGRSDLPHDDVPESHRPVVELDGHVHLGASTPTGPVALPARWIGRNRFRTSAEALRLIGARLPGPAVAVFDRSERPRPDHKLGTMFRGRAALVAVDGWAATVAVDADRITTWDGFRAETLEAS
jgi:hypothetical protein